MKKNLSIALILLFSISQIFAQSFLSNKYTIAYKKVNNHEIKADIHLPLLGENTPVLIYFHGGGFIFGNRVEGLHEKLKNKLIENGIAVISADYRLAPETNLSGILEDVKDIIKWVKKNGKLKYNLNTENISIGGGSAGGYLALFSGIQESFPPTKIIAISAPTGQTGANMKTGDITLMKKSGPCDAIKDYPISYGDYSTRMDLWRYLARNRISSYAVFGFDTNKHPEKLKRFKLRGNITTKYPQTLLVYANYDRLIKISEGESFHKLLKSKNIKSELFTVDYGHSTRLLDQNSSAIDKIVEFIKK